MWIVGPYVRNFDYTSAQRVDTWIANSQEVAKRIEKFYRKRATVIYPPIELKQTNSKVKKENYYLMISRIVGGKGIAEAARAFKELDIPLKIVGEVVDTRLAAQVESLGRVSEDELARLYSAAKGFVALSRDEDLGMTVVESMLSGTPVLAYRAGGYLETVKSGKTGVFVEGLSTRDIEQGVRQMEKIAWDQTTIKKWAKMFGRARFERQVRQVVRA
jgi:glycosyltransferase involved in cell wall biosynthesis